METATQIMMRTRAPTRRDIWFRMHFAEQMVKQLTKVLVDWEMCQPPKPMLISSMPETEAEWQAMHPARQEPETITSCRALLAAHQKIAVLARRELQAMDRAAR